MATVLPYEQLTVEKLAIIRGLRKWANPLGARNEAFDCRALAVCALHSRLLAGLDLNGWAGQFEQMLKPPVPGRRPRNPSPTVLRPWPARNGWISDPIAHILSANSRNWAGRRSVSWLFRL